MTFNIQNKKWAAAGFPLKVLAVAFILTFLLVGTLSWFSWNSYNELEGSQKQALSILELNGVILQYDEILTMSAKMASVTGDLYWEDRYDKFEPELTLAIKKLSVIAPDLFAGESALKMAAANTKLVGMEKAAFKLVRDGKFNEAKALLISKDYENEKTIYTTGIEQLKKDLDAKTRVLLERQSRRGMLSLLASLAVIPLLLFTWVVTYQEIKMYIEKRKRSEEALRRSEANCRELYELAPIGFALCTMDGQFVSVNAAYAEIIGHSVDETLQLSYWQITPEKYAAEEKRQLLQLKEIGRYGPYEKEYQHKHGYLVPVRLNGMIVEREGQQLIWSSIEDITALKQAEQESHELLDQLRQSHKMEAIGTLAGGIAHDFNNILTVILGYAEMAMDDIPDTSPARDKLEHVVQAGNRAKELVSHILSFSRKEAGERLPVDIYLVVKETLDLLRSSIPTTIEMTQHLDSQCGNILANATQVHQVLMNLCTNAAQAMDESGGVLEVELAPVVLSADDLGHESNLKPGDYVRLCVKDSGIGIDQKNLEKIFDPYFTTKDVGKGSGMGLSVVIGIVKSHDGMITVESACGEGTIVKVYFPQINEECKGKQDDREFLPGGKEKILIVDDDENIAYLTQQICERLGYQVTTKTSSREALDLFRSQPESFDIIISDQTMPEMTGDELAKNVLDIRPSMPIIICSGYSSRMDADKANSIGIAAFIMKPVDKKQLANTIRNVLDRTGANA